MSDTDGRGCDYSLDMLRFWFGHGLVLCAGWGVPVEHRRAQVGFVPSWQHFHVGHGICWWSALDLVSKQSIGMPRSDLFLDGNALFDTLYRVEDWFAGQQLEKLRWVWCPSNVLGDALRHALWV